MVDMFTNKHAVQLLRNKRIMLVGDSNMRAMYKDIVTLLNRNELIELGILRRRGEPTFEGDRRTNYVALTRGRDYVEGREFRRYGGSVSFHFTTRCYNRQIQRILDDIRIGIMQPPDVFIMNSCIWDISRWGPNGVNDFKENMIKLLTHLKKSLSKSTLFIWTTTLPVSKKIRGGLLVKQIDFLEPMLRFEIMEANLFCRDQVAKHGFDVLDFHYHLRSQIHRRLPDGIHYDPLVMRFVTNLLLLHISFAWGAELPGNVEGVLMNRLKKMAAEKSFAVCGGQVKLPEIPKCLTAKRGIPTHAGGIRLGLLPSPDNKNKRKKRKNTNARNQPTSSYNANLGLVNEHIPEIINTAIWNVKDILEKSSSLRQFPDNMQPQPFQEPFWKDTYEEPRNAEWSGNSYGRERTALDNSWYATGNSGSRRAASRENNKRCSNWGSRDIWDRDGPTDAWSRDVPYNSNVWDYRDAPYRNYNQVKDRRDWWSEQGPDASRDCRPRYNDKRPIGPLRRNDVRGWYRSRPY